MVVLVLLGVGGCGDNYNLGLYFTYDPDRYVLCPQKLDDDRDPVDWDLIDKRIHDAVELHWVYGLYAHRPGVSIRLETLEHTLDLIDAAGLPYLRYRDLDPDTVPTPGVVLAFDDDFIAEWASMREILDRHGAKVTFFVTRYAAFTDDERAELHRFADEGHGVEAHGMLHLAATDYVATHGMQAYLDDEVLPSLKILQDDGFPAESFAYPFGDHDDDIDRALEPHVRYVRTIAAKCPY